jgi:sortase A
MEMGHAGKRMCGSYRAAIAALVVVLVLLAARQSAAQHSAENTPAIDFTDWSNVRIKAYSQALALPFPEPMAELSVPRLHLFAPLFDGTDDVTLDRGVGRIPGTALPGESGNVGVAGHRDGFFRRLKDIQVGDTIEISAADQSTTYRVERVEIVSPSDVQVLKSGSTPSLTLVTCYPFYFAGHAPQRFIVEATLVQHSAKAQAAAPERHVASANQQ